MSILGNIESAVVCDQRGLVLIFEHLILNKEDYVTDVQNETVILTWEELRILQRMAREQAKLDK